MIRPLLLATLLAGSAHAATLRPLTTLSGETVRLSDLFDAAGVDREIGPAPQPGGRIIVEAAQLAAIARQFGVDWRPASSADRIVLDRPGRLFPREDAMDALRAALAGAGVSPDALLETPSFTPPTVPADAKAAADVAQVEYDAGSGRFTALLSITAAGMPPAHIRISGKVTEMVDLPVSTRRMMPGDVVAAGDITVSRIRASLVHAEMARLPAQAVGMAVRRPIQPGAPFPMADLGRPSAVLKGAPVQMVMEGPGLSLTAQGMAMEAGALGERIRVLNPASRAVVDAVVAGAGLVRVNGGTATLLPAGIALPVRVAAR